jgi:hypothetical protein
MRYLMTESKSNKDSPDRSISKEILSERDKMVNLRLPSDFMPMYWGFDLSPPHFTYPNDLSKHISFFHQLAKS